MCNIYISQLFSDEEVAEVMKIKKIGLELIDFGIGENLDKDDNGLADYMSRMGKIIEDRSISLHGPFLDLNPASFDSLIKNATLKRYNQVYSVAKILGADRIIFHSCYNENIYFKETYIKKSVEFWKEFLLDKDDSIKLHIENVLENGIDHLVEVIDGVGCDCLTICLDIGHANCYSEFSVEQWIETLGKRIGHIHLHNNYGIKDSHNGLKNGNIDIKCVLEKINKFCDNTSITLEINKFDEVEESIHIISEIFKLD